MIKQIKETPHDVLGTTQCVVRDKAQKIYNYLNDNVKDGSIDNVLPKLQKYMSIADSTAYRYFEYLEKAKLIKRENRSWRKIILLDIAQEADNNSPKGNVDMSSFDEISFEGLKGSHKTHSTVYKYIAQKINENGGEYHVPKLQELAKDLSYSSQAIGYALRNLVTVKLLRQKGARNKKILSFFDAPQLKDENVIDFIENCAIEIRGQTGLLDKDLAQVYEVTTSALNQARKRNKRRFSESYAFQVTEQEWDKLREKGSETVMNKGEGEKSQIIQKQQISLSGRHGHMPWFYTREGCNMMSTRLYTDIAINRSKIIVKFFSEMERLAQGEQPNDPRYQDFTIKLGKQQELIKQQGKQQELIIQQQQMMITGMQDVADLGQQSHFELEQEIEVVRGQLADAIQVAKNASSQASQADRIIKEERTRRQTKEVMHRRYKYVNKLKKLLRIYAKLNGRKHGSVWCEFEESYGYQVEETPPGEMEKICQEWFDLVRIQCNKFVDEAKLNLNESEQSWLIGQGIWERTQRVFPFV